MRNRLLLFLLLLAPGFLAAQNDSVPVSPKAKKFCISLQGGPPVRILATDFVDEDAPGYLPIGRLRRYAYSLGGALRYYYTPSISFTARFALVRRDFLASDSTYDIIGESNDGVVHAMSASAKYVYTDYTMRNMFVGLGASYEKPIGRLKVSTGMELAYVRYLQVKYNNGSRSYSIVSNDSLANAHDYNSTRVNTYYDNETFPNVSSFGLMMHGGFEFMFCPHFGMSTTILFGGFYSWAKHATFTEVNGNSSDFTDSNGVHTHSGAETIYDSKYSRTQFDFSPPTCVVGLNFYL